jgi:hypothetical protein
MLRLSLVGLVVLAACEPNNQGYAPEQPIVYSHAVHAGELQIPCQYCHFGASRGRYAGIPPTAVCMNCHMQAIPDHPEVQKLTTAIETGQPIEWVRVHWLPDHVYFNHSSHVTAGIACQSCHGPVEEMGRVEQWAPLTMGWCVNCHRANAPEDVLATPGATRQANRLTDCGTCHH